MSTTEDQATEQEQQRAVTKKEQRLRMMKSPNFYRQGFKEVRGDVEQVMGSQFKSGIVDDLKSSNYVMERDNVKVYLAKVCVCLSDRAVFRSGLLFVL
jgi:4-hydroxy-3-methylbut-2-en-1-yl diphosphate reductase